MHQIAAEEAEARRVEAQATDFAERGLFGQAIASFRHAIELKPSDAKLHEALAQCLLELEDYEGATTAAFEAVRLDPCWSIGHSTLGRVFFNLGHLQEAVECLRRAVVINADTEVQDELSEWESLLERHWKEFHDIKVPLHSAKW
eukprot:4893018-Amphidinium_carterae.1